MHDVTLTTRETLCELLKRATDADHGSAEKVSPMTRLMSEDVELTDFADVLKRLALFHGALEPQICMTTPQTRLVQRVARVPLLRADLRALGIRNEGDPAGAGGRLDLSNPSFRAGALYVVEGSALGGKVIGAHLRRRFGTPVAGSLSYYGLYGSDVARTWRDVKNEINASGADPDRAVEGAKRAFRLFERAMQCRMPVASRRRNRSDRSARRIDRQQLRPA
ncbi:MAG: biliverdin-producing heme oxygenase [Pseudomonadota bacterium]